MIGVRGRNRRTQRILAELNTNTSSIKSRLAGRFA
jgi:hypothetical protein